MLLIRLFCLVALGYAFPAVGHGVGAEMAEAAGRFLAALTPEQRTVAQFEWAVAERSNWHFVPRDRKGLALADLEPAQRHLAMGLLGSGLSQRGLMTATTIMSLEAVLRDLEQGRGPLRDPERYYVSIFGAPSPQAPWGWRLEGHHLSLNFTVIADDAVTFAPSMFGANPAEVRRGPRQGLRALADQEDLARGLVRSLSPSQRELALLRGAVPRDILLQPGREARSLEPLGVPASDLDEAQRALLVEVIEVYVGRYRPELAEPSWETLRATAPQDLHFAWAGSLEPGHGHYYRVQGPTFVLEYDNTQNDANHIHATWRDLRNDFGVDPLREHYRTTPHEAARAATD